MSAMKRETIDPKTNNIGDWVRFTKNGSLVLGVVQYLPFESHYRSFWVDTDAGIADVEQIREVRKASQSQ